MNLIANKCSRFAMVTNLIKYFDLFHVFIAKVIRLSMIACYQPNEREQKRTIKIEKSIIDSSIRAELIISSMNCINIITLFSFQ